MGASRLKVHATDVVVVGTGVGGLATALYLDGRRVTVVTKTTLGRGGSSERAQGGVAVALAADDSPELHARDTLAAGCGLSDPDVAELITRDGPRRIRELMRLGAQLDREPSGVVALGREGAHSRRRIVHAEGDATGAEMVRALAGALESTDGLHLAEHTFALDLLVDDGRIAGLLVMTSSGEPMLILAPAVILATGGIGHLYSRTTNPAECTGDGLAMAARAGARLAGLELVQLHPTALADGSDPMALLTEALRGEGAVLIDEQDERFMAQAHASAELAPRDVVARAIWRHRRAGHQTLLDATSIGERFSTRFPTVLALCLERGLDPRREPIPVSPAAHYHMGGIVVDAAGRTSIPGLWACGECASTGLHGANRLASNSLLEALVLGARVGESLSSALLVSPDPVVGVGLARAALRGRTVGVPDLDPLRTATARRRLREVMWRWVGVERDASGLTRALAEIADVEALAFRGRSGRHAADAAANPAVGVTQDRSCAELGNMIEVARLVARSALARTESRGAHFRSDIPLTSPHWQQDVVFEGTRQLLPVAREAAEVV